MSHYRVSEWRAGFINLCQPSTHEFGGHLSLRSVRRAHAAGSVSFSIFTVHLRGHGSATTALHHEVLLLAALLPAAGVQRVFSRHHRGKWEQTGRCLTGRWRAIGLDGENAEQGLGFSENKWAMAGVQCLIFSLDLVANILHEYLRFKPFFDNEKMELQN